VETVQFYLLWGILFINVTAGIGILSQASPMMQDLFSKKPRWKPAPWFLSSACLMRRPILLGLEFRLHWTSEYLHTFFVVQFALFLLIPGIAAAGIVGAFS
jgi:hypothetical protein